MDNDITFSKIVATPTQKTWSQAYNAGKLFIVVSLEKTEGIPESESLNILGKDLLERLEKEFFAIENKNLESIKTAISTVFLQEPEGVKVSLALGTIINNVLYLFGLGNAKVLVKRDADIGLVLDSESADPTEIASSSGFLEAKDLIILATEAFSQIITKDDLMHSLADNDPTQITESLAPKIHESQNGKVSAIIIKYQKQLVDETAGDIKIEKELEEIQIDEKTMKKALSSPLTQCFNFFNLKLKKLNFKIQFRKKIFLALIVVIAAILIYSVFASIQEQKNAKMKALFAQVYPEALKKYDEGESLVKLNKNFARDSFLAAEKILQDNKSDFTTNSKELTQIQDLLKKVEDGLNQTSPIDKSGVDRSKVSILVENGSGVEGVAGKAAGVLKALGYEKVETGNADNYDYEGVTIETKTGQDKLANLLKKDLSKDYAVKSVSSDLPLDSSTDVLVIIGK